MFVLLYPKAYLHFPVNSCSNNFTSNFEFLILVSLSYTLFCILKIVYVWCTVCGHVGLLVCMPMTVCHVWGPDEDIGCSVNINLILLTRRLSLNLELDFLIDWQPTSPSNPPASTPPSFGLQMSQWPYLAFYVDSGDWNSGHHPCPASFYPLNFSVALILCFKLYIICYRIPTDKMVTSIQGN